MMHNGRMRVPMKRNGFTLVEMLVVIAVTALLSGLAIVYSHVGQNQIALSVESSKVAQLILEAKDLSVATYSDKQTTCGYGLHFDYTAQQYSLFEYDLPSGQTVCPSLGALTAAGYMQSSGALLETEYAGGSWNVAPAQGVALVDGAAASGTIRDIIFYPPDPFTLISYDGKTLYDSYNATMAPDTAGGNIYLATVDGSDERAVAMSFAGQVNL